MSARSYGSRAIVARAVRLIVEEGALDAAGTSVETAAERLGMGRRELARLFAGASEGESERGRRDGPRSAGETADR